jgi:hypothetical protein
VPIPLSKKTKQAAEILLAEGVRSRVEERLVADTSEGIPLWQELTPEGLERIRFAVLKLIAQNPKNENIAFKYAKVDWRDLFMAAGFGESATEHERWYSTLSKRKA